MGTRVIVKVLAKDIEESDYSDHADCAITRALSRTDKLSKFYDCVGLYKFRSDKKYDPKGYKRLQHRVRCMYKYLGEYGGGEEFTPEKPKNFQVTLTF